MKKILLILLLFVGFSSYSQTSSDPDAVAFITALNADTNNVDLTVNEMNYITQMVEGMKSIGVWTKMNAVYPVVGGNAFKHKFNLKNPLDTDGAFRLVFNGTVSNNSLGFSAGGSALNYANTFIIPSVSLTNENVHSSVYYTSIGTNSVSLGAISGLNILAIDVGGFAYISNSTAFDKITFTPNGNVIKSCLISYKDSDFKILVNGSNAIKTNQESIGSTLPNVPMFIGVLNGSGQNSTRRHGFVSIGSGLTDSEAQRLSHLIYYCQGILSRQ